MKKLIFILMTSVMMACASEEGKEKEYEKQKFERDLSAFIEKQKMWLLSNETRSDAAEKSVEDLLAMGETLDDEISCFVAANEKIIMESILNNEKLTELEWDMLMLDENRMLNYVNTNVSKNIGKVACDFLNGDFSITMDEIEDDMKLTPYEKTVMISLAMHVDYKKQLVVAFAELEKEDGDIDNTCLLADAQRDLALCDDDYLMEIRDCGLVAIGGMIGGFLTGGSIWLPTIGAYGLCQYSARKAYNRCKRDVRLRYGL